MMYFDGRPLRIAEFCQFIHSMVDEAEKVMCDKLLFGNGNRLHSVNLSNLRDDVNVANIKNSFVSNLENDLLEGREKMITALKNSTAWSKMMSVESDFSSGRGELRSMKQRWKCSWNTY
jgi:hypothetical protein